MNRASSKDVVQVDTGSLCPALHRLEKKKWVCADWDLSENRQRVRVDKLTDRVAWLVVRRTSMLVVPGIMVGLLIALSLTRVMSKLLYDVSASDPWTFSLVGLVLGSWRSSRRRRRRGGPAESTR